MRCQDGNSNHTGPNVNKPKVNVNVKCRKNIYWREALSLASHLLKLCVLMRLISLIVLVITFYRCAYSNSAKRICCTNWSWSFGLRYTHQGNTSVALERSVSQHQPWHTLVITFGRGCDVQYHSLLCNLVNSLITLSEAFLWLDEVLHLSHRAGNVHNQSWQSGGKLNVLYFLKINKIFVCFQLDGVKKLCHVKRFWREKRNFYCHVVATLLFDFVDVLRMGRESEWVM